MTEITRWRDPGVKPHAAGPLPPPPRTHRTATQAADPLARALEEWLDDLTVASTVDAD